MGKSILIALSNPVSQDREGEYNEWYNEVHAKEVTQLEGFRNITRYRAVASAVPPNQQPAYRYLALYELDDAEKALKSLANADFAMTDAVDLSGASGIVFQKIFTTKE